MKINFPKKITKIRLPKKLLIPGAILIVAATSYFWFPVCVAMFGLMLTIILIIAATVLLVSRYFKRRGRGLGWKLPTIFSEQIRASRTYKFIKTFCVLIFIFVATSLLWLATAIYYCGANDTLERERDFLRAERDASFECLANVGSYVSGYDSAVTDAYAKALLITDAYIDGGQAKAQVLYDEFLEDAGRSDDYYYSITDTLSRCGVVVDGEVADEGNGI